MILAPTLTPHTPSGGYDADATAFAAASGATDVAALSAFVKGVKELGLWENMVCWPLRSSQNAGTGTTAYSLGGLGTYDGTLVNGPAWSASGLTTTGATGQKVYVGDWNQIVGSAPVNEMSFGLVVVSGAAAMGHWQGASSGYEIGLLWDTAANSNLWAPWGTIWYSSLNVTNPQTGPAFVYSHRQSATVVTWHANGSSLPIDFGSPDSDASSTAIVHSGDPNFTPSFLTNGRGLAADALTGVSAFYYIIKGAADNQALRSLYKSTLGTGLGLP